MNATASTPRLPTLRQDLALYSAPASPDGSPCWHLHDPSANKFYQLGWAAFEVLSRWELGTANAIISSVQAETTLQIDADSVKSMADFLERHNLFEALQQIDSNRLAASLAASKMHWAKWLLHNYLFFRVPMLRPDAWLGRWVHLIPPLLDRRFWWVMGALAFTALILVMRQWEQFLNGFTAFSGWETILAFGVAMSLAKMAHELGHAFVAKHHGCKVPTMGLAFLVMWPVLYTDTNEAWKLPSNRARFQISIAGMATEMVVAVFATWLWLLLPDGPARAAAFFLATSSWVMTLALNASPFMRFDGYFLLADTLGMPNLHNRAFAFGRWWLRERLFALGDPVPETLALPRQRFMIGFAYATWLYRLVLFLSIALMVYYAFFKVLGILLMLVEIAWFLVRPILQEVEAWWMRRHGMAWNKTTRRTLTLLLLFMTWLILPWQGEIAAPAILAPAKEQGVYAPIAAQIVSYPVASRSKVLKDEVLLELYSPDLDQRLKQAQISEANLRTQLEQQAFNTNLLLQGEALTHHWEEAAAQAAGLQNEQARMTIHARFDGEILFRGEDLLPGTWVTAREKLLAIADRRQNQVEAFVGENELDRLHLDAPARFIPEAPEFGRHHCRIAEIERVNLAELEDPMLASVYGGALPTRLDRRGIVTPAFPLYRIKLDRCMPELAPALRIRGVAHLDADGRSLLVTAFRQVLAVLIKESGF